MKALILFDGGKSSIRSLQVACQDARRLETGQNNLIVAVLGLVPYGIDLKSQLAEYEELAELLFYQASKYVQGGEYNKVSGELLLCREDRVTEVLAEYFDEFQLDSIYIPAPSTFSIPAVSHKNHENIFQRIFRKSIKPESHPETVVGRKPLAELIYPSVLIKAITGKVILTDAEGIITRLSGLHSSHVVRKEDTARAAVQSEGFIEVRPSMVENFRIKSLHSLN